MDKVETKSNTLDGKAIHKAWAGNRVYLGQLTVTRVMTDDPSWDLWFNTAVKDVKAARKNGVVTIYNQEYMPDPGVHLQKRLADSNSRSPA